MTRTFAGSIGLALALLTVSACGQDDAEEAASPQPEAGQTQPPAPEPDLEGVPDVVAEVNGEEILKEDFVTAYEQQFPQLAQQAQMSGQEVDQDQLRTMTAESMVSTELLVQEADERDLSASEDEVQGALDELTTSNGMESSEEFLTALEEQGMSEDEVRSELETQVVVEELIAAEAGDTEPTEEELRALYDEATRMQGQGGEADAAELPAFEEVRPQLEQQVRAEKESAATQELITELREDADVTIHL